MVPRGFSSLIKVACMWGGKGFPSHVRGVAVAPRRGEPDPAHPTEGRITAADVVGGRRHHFGNPGWSGSEVVGKPLQVQELVPSFLMDPHTVVLPGAQDQL